MSWFRRVFGTKERPPTPQDAMSRLDEVIVSLEKRSDFLEDKIKEQTEVAKSNAKSNRRVALAALSRRRRFDKELQSLDHTASNLEYQRDALGNAKMQGEIFEAMTAGGKALEAAQKYMSVDDVEQLQDDLDDQLQQAEDVRTALARPLWGADGDMDELDEELEQMLLDDELTELPQASPAAASKPHSAAGNLRPADLPSVPTHNPGPDRKTKGLSPLDEAELAELADWAE